MNDRASILCIVSIIYTILYPSVAYTRVDGPSFEEITARVKLQCASDVLKLLKCDDFIKMTYVQQETNINLLLSKPCEMSLIKSAIDDADSWCTNNKEKQKDLGEWFIEFTKKIMDSSISQNINNKTIQEEPVKITEKFCYGKLLIESTEDTSASSPERDITAYKDGTIVFTSAGGPEYKKIIKDNIVIYFLTVYNVGSGGGGETFIFDDNGHIYDGIPKQSIVKNVTIKNNLLLVQCWVQSDESKQGLQRTYILKNKNFIMK